MESSSPTGRRRGGGERALPLLARLRLEMAMAPTSARATPRPPRVRESVMCKESDEPRNLQHLHAFTLWGKFCPNRACFATLREAPCRAQAECTGLMMLRPGWACSTLLGLLAVAAEPASIHLASDEARINFGAGATPSGTLRAGPGHAAPFTTRGHELLDMNLLA